MIPITIPNQQPCQYEGCSCGEQAQAKFQKKYLCLTHFFLVRKARSNRLKQIHKLNREQQTQ